MKNTVIDPLKMELSLEKAYKLINAIANKNRMLILCHLCTGEKNVSEIEEECGIYQPTLSQQIGILRDEELITARRDGKKIYYSISNSVALEVIQVLYKNYCK
jgi:DNA-binding transcriptional ArsR family regulator